MLLLQGHAADSGQLDAIPAWLLAQLRVAAEPLNRTLLDTTLLCARAAAVRGSRAALPLMSLEELRDIIEEGEPLVGRGSAAAPLAAAYVLTVVALASRSQAEVEVWPLPPQRSASLATLRSFAPAHARFQASQRVPPVCTAEASHGLWRAV